MKRTILMTVLAMSLALGSSWAYGGGGCRTCKVPSDASTYSATLSSWEQFRLVFSAFYGI